MQYFEVILENGHIGAGSSYEAKRYIAGKDILSVISKVRSLPRIKKRHTIEAVKSIRPVTKKEYIRGKIKELQSPHLFKVWGGGYRCPICGRWFSDIVSFKQHTERHAVTMAFAG